MTHTRIFRGVLLARVVAGETAGDAGAGNIQKLATAAVHLGRRRARTSGGMKAARLGPAETTARRE